MAGFPRLWNRVEGPNQLSRMDVPCANVSGRPERGLFLQVRSSNDEVLINSGRWRKAIVTIRKFVGCTGPEPHGMTIWESNFWLCDAASQEVLTFPVPKP